MLQGGMAAVVELREDPRTVAVDASVVRRFNGIVAGSQAATYFRDIWPSGMVAIEPSTTRPTPPQARSSR